MRYHVLGTLQITDGSAAFSVSARKVHQLAAVLLIRANQTVSCDQISYELWGDNPPKRAAAGMHVYVSQLRKALDRGDGSPSPLVTCSPGYLLRVADDELDLHAFRRLATQGRQLARRGQHEQACELLETALDLWRGPALAELRTGPIVDGFLTWLEEFRLESLELFVESNFTLGRHRELVSLLFTLVADHPLHEAFYQQLMLALYRCDRRADALRVYRNARQTIIRELGLEPCAALQRLHFAILQSNDRVLGHHRVLGHERAAVSFAS